MELIEGITCVYGPPASGKTNICLFKAARAKGKVIYIDTENTFSAKRVKDFNPDADLDNIYLMKVDSFERQEKVIKELELLRKADLIVIDSLTKYYRKALQDDENPDLLSQLKILRGIYKSLGCNVLITSQVYSTQEGDSLPLGGKPLRDFSKQLISLSNEGRRRMEFIKPEPKIRGFAISTPSIDFS